MKEWTCIDCRSPNAEKSMTITNPTNGRSLVFHMCGDCHQRYCSMPTQKAIDELMNCDGV